MAPRNGSARWNGDLPTGSGTVTVGDNAWTGNYSYAARFADGAGTDPEELIAAAHANCFSMALVYALTEAGHTPRSVETTARAHLRMVEGMPTIQQIDLDTTVNAPDIDQHGLEELATNSEDNLRGIPSFEA